MYYFLEFCERSQLSLLLNKQKNMTSHIHANFTDSNIDN